MAAWAALGAGIAATGSLVSSALSSRDTANLNKTNRQWQEEMWQKNNEYNTPANQKKRLEEAGINPYSVLAQGGADTGNSSSPAATPQTYQKDYSGVASAGMQAMQAYQSLSSMSKDNKLKDIQIEKGNTDLEFYRIKLIEDINEQRARIRAQLASANKDSAEYEKLQNELLYYDEYLQSILDTTKSNQKIAESNAKWRYQLNEDEHINNVYSKMLSHQQIEVLKSEIPLNAEKVRTEITQQHLNAKAAAKMISDIASNVTDRVVKRSSDKRAWAQIYQSIAIDIYDRMQTEGRWSIGPLKVDLPIDNRNAYLNEMKKELEKFFP